MPLDAEFKKHLHSLMVEVLENTTAEIEQHKRELVFKAQQTNNSAAPPIALKDAALYSMEFRLSRTIEKYIEAVAIWDYSIDAAFERDMIQEFWSLTAGPNRIQFPPMMMQNVQHAEAVQRSYGMERQRLAAKLVRAGTNRLRELKMKSMQAKRTSGNTTNNTFNGPVGSAYINSTVQTTHITITATVLQQIEQISAGHPELQAVALELRSAQGTSVVEKLSKWASLALSISGLADKIHQYYPQIAALIEYLKSAKG